MTDQAIDRSRLREVAERVVRDYLAVQPEEAFLLVTDDDTDQEIPAAILAAACDLGNDPTHAVIRARRRSGEEPPALVQTAMAAADVCLCLSSKSLYHTKAKGVAQSSGTRGCFNGPHVVDAWVQGAMTADFFTIRGLATRIADRLRGADQVHVTSPAGTDMTVYVGGREPKAWLSGVVHKPGEISAYPGGEVSFPPLEGTSHGRIVVEQVMTDVGRVAEPIILTIVDGQCTKIEGGAEAAKLRTLIEGVPGATNLAELGIGLNDKARVTSIITEAKKAYGTAHFALGDNAGGYGGVVECPLHLDGLNLEVTITVDGAPIVTGGHIVV